MTLYVSLAGDFQTVLPYALLEARRHFLRQSHQNPSDSDENLCRALACEALARKVVARTELEDQYCLLSARFRRVTSSGEVTEFTSGKFRPSPCLLELKEDQISRPDTSFE